MHFKREFSVEKINLILAEIDLGNVEQVKHFFTPLFEKGWYGNSSSSGGYMNRVNKSLYLAGLIKEYGERQKDMTDISFSTHRGEQCLWLIEECNTHILRAVVSFGGKPNKYLNPLKDISDALGVEMSEWVKVELLTLDLNKVVDEASSLRQQLTAKSAELTEVMQKQQTKEEIAEAMAKALSVQSELAFVNLKLAAQKAIADLAATKGISKSRKFAQIRKDLETAIYPSPSADGEDDGEDDEDSGSGSGSWGRRRY